MQPCTTLTLPMKGAAETDAPQLLQAGAERRGAQRRASGRAGLRERRGAAVGAAAGGGQAARARRQRA
jgi:hypothetical protein